MSYARRYWNIEFLALVALDITVTAASDPDHIAETYLQLHRQHRSTWPFEVVLRPWVEKW